MTLYALLGGLLALLAAIWWAYRRGRDRGRLEGAEATLGVLRERNTVERHIAKMDDDELRESAVRRARERRPERVRRSF